MNTGMTHLQLDGQHDARQLRTALGRFPTGVTVITTRTPDGTLTGLTANSFAALSLDPPLVLWSLRHSSPSLARFVESGHFAINVLSAAQSDLSHRFATPHENKFDGVEFDEGFGGSPRLSGVLACFECRTETTVQGGDHLLFIGRVHALAFSDGEPLIFNAGRYCTSVPVRRNAAAAEGDLNDIWGGLG